MSSAVPGTGLVFDGGFLRHEPGPGHPESPDRLHALKKALHSSGWISRLAPVAPRMATEDELLLCHTRPYLANVRFDIARRSPALSTGDTAISEHSLHVAALAAGGALAAVDAVFSGRARNCFVASRPPGHHATASRGMGFCIFNNVALAARYAQKTYGAGRILIADWDVHHGNGTQDIFYRDASVFYFSTHQAPWYPGTGAASETGAGPGKGATLNCPLPAGAARSEILGAFRSKLLPAMRDFRPDFVLLSAGFDSRRGDPLGRFSLRDRDFAELTYVVLEIAALSAGGRLVSVLEGGYHLPGFARAAVAHLEALASGT